MEDKINVELKGVVLKEGEEITEDTLAELTDGKGED